MNAAETIQFRTLEYDYDPGFEAMLVLEGETEEFTSVVTQERELGSSNSPFDVMVVSNVTRANEKENEEEEAGNAEEILYEEGEVAFSVEGLLNKERIRYTGIYENPLEEAVDVDEPEVLEENENPELLNDNQEGI